MLRRANPAAKKKRGDRSSLFRKASAAVRPGRKAYPFYRLTLPFRVCSENCSTVQSHFRSHLVRRLTKWNSIGKHKRVTRVLSQRVVCHHKLPRTGHFGRTGSQMRSALNWQNNFPVTRANLTKASGVLTLPAGPNHLG